MPEQLNERERWLIFQGWNARGEWADVRDIYEEVGAYAPSDPRDAEIERLNGLLDEVDGLRVARAHAEIGQPAMLNGLFEILSRRTAERKERGDAPRRCFWCQGAGSIVAKGEGKAWDVPCPDCGGSGKEPTDASD